MRIISTILLAIILQSVISLNALSQTYVWTQKANFSGGLRYAATGFSIGTKGYVGLGTFNGTSYNDFWEYNPATDVWTQLADLTGPGRYGASGFSIGGKGYVTTGWSPAPLNDMWEYDPVLNAWAQKNNFPGASRYAATSFVIGNYAYLGCGYSPLQKDFWKYDPVLDSWTQIADVGGLERQNAVGFSIGNDGYVFGGGAQFASYSKELWKYDPALNTWTQKSDLPGPERCAGAAFSFNGKGFTGVGTTDLNVYQDFYQYNPLSDTWTQVNDFGGGQRQAPAFFAVGNIGYCGTGSSGIFPNLVNYQDWWSFQEVNDHNLIVGNLYVDDNQNQILDSTEAPVKNVIVQMLPGPVYVSSNSTGIYAIIADSGSFDISIPNPPLYYTYAPSLINVNFPQVNQIDSGNNFAFNPTGLINDVQVVLTPMGIIRANNPDYLNVTYKNVGTTVMNGTIEVQLDTNMIYTSTYPYDSSIVQIGNLLTWSYSNLQPGESRAFIVNCLISNNVFLNDTLSMSATINPVAGDSMPSDNTDNQVQVAVGSFDPNDKSVNKENLDILQISNWGWLDYVIRFQNTGTAPAIDIVVTDSLSALLDVPTFEILAASNPYYFKMEGTGKITWTFKNIWLPDSNSNEPASHGFIRFRIKPKNNLVLGNVIENFAAIYFDNNPAVITNTATTTIVSATAINDLEKNATAITVFPNPNDGKCLLSFQAKNPGKAKMEIMNTNGQVVINKNIAIKSGFNNLVITEKLTTGIYFVRIKSPDKTYLTKYVVQ